VVILQLMVALEEMQHPLTQENHIILLVVVAVEQVLFMVLAVLVGLTQTEVLQLLMRQGVVDWVEMALVPLVLVATKVLVVAELVQVIMEL
jgi:hypothetical protein